MNWWYRTINNVTLSFFSSQNVNHLNFSFDIIFHPLTDCFLLWMNYVIMHLEHRRLEKISICHPLGFMIELFLTHNPNSYAYLHARVMVSWNNRFVFSIFDNHSNICKKLKSYNLSLRADQNRAMSCWLLKKPSW